MNIRFSVLAVLLVLLSGCGIVSLDTNLPFFYYYPVTSVNTSSNTVLVGIVGTRHSIHFPQEATLANGLRVGVVNPGETGTNSLQNFTGYWGKEANALFQQVDSSGALVATATIDGLWVSRNSWNADTFVITNDGITWEGSLVRSWIRVK